MIFGTLNPEKIWHANLTYLSTSPVRCSYSTLGNRKKSFSTLLFIYFRLFTLSQKKTNSNCCTAALAVFLLLLNASYYLHSPSNASGARYRRCASGRVEARDCGLLRHGGWISAHRGVLCDWLVTKKSGNIYWRRSLWTLAVTLLAWHSSFHTSQPVLFRAPEDNAQLALFGAYKVWNNATNLQSDEKVLQFTS